MEARVCRARTTPNAKPDTISRGTDRHQIWNICLMISENSKGGLKLCPIARNPNRPTSPAASKSLITCAATTARIPAVFVLQASVAATQKYWFCCVPGSPERGRREIGCTHFEIDNRANANGDFQATERLRSNFCMLPMQVLALLECSGEEFRPTDDERSL